MSRIHYPIINTIVEHGHAREAVLEKTDKVRCYFCDAVFPVFRNVVVPGAFDCNKALRCPECGKVVSVLYYYDRKVNE